MNGLADPHGPGELLRLIRGAGSLTRAELLDRSGLSRSTVTARLQLLLDAGLVIGDTHTATRGRPAECFGFHDAAGLLLIAHAGATGVRLALTDLGGGVLDSRVVPWDVTDGPERCLTMVGDVFAELLSGAGRRGADVQGIGLALPGPVDAESGTVVSPPIMPGWDQFDIRAWFAGRYGCPVIVENDVNAMAVGEYRSAHPDADSMLLLKVSTGIGAGIIAGGSLYRGADGAAHATSATSASSSRTRRCPPAVAATRAAPRRMPPAGPWCATCGPRAATSPRSRASWRSCEAATPSRST